MKKLCYLLSDAKEFPEAVAFDTYTDSDIMISHPGICPEVARDKPTIYEKELDGDEVYYTCEGKDCFSFKKTVFGWIATMLECDTRNIPYYEENYNLDFIGVLSKVCSEYMEVSGLVQKSKE